MRDSVTVQMSAQPQKVWELVSDITNTGKFSPETFEAEWLDGADEPVVGARFRGHVKRNGRGPTYWTNCEVTASEPGREFAFRVLGPGDRTVNTWGYQFEPKAGGTAATEYFELPNMLPMRIYWALAGWARGKTNRDGMRTTLERIKAVAEAE
ncbi:MAG: SRPBCC family protein [Acidimicrobiales bacterium]